MYYLTLHLLINKIIEQNNSSDFSRDAKKFCVDPQHTSLDVLISLISQAFSLNE
jgi:hypothetical protein